MKTFLWIAGVAIALFLAFAYVYPFFVKVSVDTTSLTCDDIAITATQSAQTTSRSALRGNDPAITFTIGITVDGKELQELRFRGEPPPEYIERTVVLREEVFEKMRRVYRESTVYVSEKKEDVPAPVTFSAREISSKDFERVSRCLKEHETKIQEVIETSLYATFLTSANLTPPGANNTRYNVPDMRFSCPDGKYLDMTYGYIHTSDRRTVGQLFADGVFVPVPVGQGGAIQSALSTPSAWSACTNSAGKNLEAFIRDLTLRTLSLD